MTKKTPAKKTPRARTTKKDPGQALEIDGRTVRLAAGMAVTAEVKTGRRRVVDYVLSPLARAVREAGIVQA